MKIVMGLSHYPPTYAAGAELYGERIARWLVAHGHSVEVVCVETIDADDHPTVRTDCQDGVIVHRLGLQLAGIGDHIGLRFRDDVLGNWFKDYFERSQPDLFHSHSSYLLTASPIETAKRLDIPVVVTLHDYWYFCPRINLLRSNGERSVKDASPAECTWCLMAERRRFRLLEQVAAKFGDHARQLRAEIGPQRWLLDHRLMTTLEERRAYLSSVLGSVDRVIVLGRLAQEILETRGFPSSKVQMITPGLDRSQWHGMPRVARSGGLRIGYMGQLAPHKGVHLLIEAFQRLRGSGTAPELTIHGNESRFPDYSAKLRRLARGNARIRFCGPYENSRVEALFTELDVLVVPSVFYETRPIVLMEAAIAGVPVVASRLPNMQYHIRDGVDGLLFAPDDVGDLARQLQRLVDEPDLLDRLARAIDPGRDVDAEMADTVDIYQSVVGGHRRARLSS